MSHVKFEFHYNRDTLTYFTAKNKSKSFFLPSWSQKLYRGLRFSTHTYIVSVLTSTDFFVMVGQFLALWPLKHSEEGVNRALSQQTVFWNFFQHALRYQFWIWYIHLVGSATHQVRFSSWSGHPDLLYSQAWVKVIFLHLWPQELYRAFRFCTLSQISFFYPRHSQLTRHSLMLATGLLGSLWLFLFDKAAILVTWSISQCHWTYMIWWKG